MNGSLVRSDHYGKVTVGQNGQARSPEDARLEENNLTHAQEKVCEILGHGRVYKRKIHPVAPPPEKESNEFEKIDSAEVADYRATRPRCKCENCAGGSCVCSQAGHRCTFMCKCKGSCNDTVLPEPSALRGTSPAPTLEERVRRMSVADVAAWATHHGRFMRYGHQFVLCRDDTTMCAYCKAHTF